MTMIFSLIKIFVPVLILLLSGVIYQSDLVNQSSQFSGRIEDDDGPIFGANIRLRNHLAISDKDGFFHLSKHARPNRITISKENYFIEAFVPTKQMTSIRLRKIPRDDCDSYRWISPNQNPNHEENCANCHRAIFDEWSRSGHSRSSTNRHFLNLYEGSDWHKNREKSWSLLDQHPDGAGVCAPCHAPTAPLGLNNNFDLRQSTKDLGLLSSVHCDFCHKIQGPGKGEFGLTHGRYQLELLRPNRSSEESTNLFFGPLEDAIRGDDVFSSFQRDSKLCAACHEGIVFGIPVYTTYSEWLNSPAKAKGQSCQSCHMASTGKMTNIAPGHGGIDRDPLSLGNHRFFATSQLDMLRKSLDLTIRPEYRSDGIRIRIELLATNVGHRIPTGFIDRQLILVIEGVDSVSGTRLPIHVGKSLSGKPGYVFAKFLTNGKEDRPAPFWDADPSTLTDTRLIPGQPYRGEFLFSGKTKELTIKLIHRRFWDEVIQAKRWPDNDMVIFKKRIILE
jgi:hypothetical protein